MRGGGFVWRCGGVRVGAREKKKRVGEPARTDIHHDVQPFSVTCIFGFFVVLSAAWLRWRPKHVLPVSSLSDWALYRCRLTFSSLPELSGNPRCSTGPRPLRRLKLQLFPRRRVSMPQPRRGKEPRRSRRPRRRLSMPQPRRGKSDFSDDGAPA